MTLRRAIRLLVALILGLPLVHTLLAWVAGLLRAMGDELAAHALGRIGVGVGVGWLVALVGLVVCLGLKASLEPDCREAVDEFEPPLS